MPDMRYGQFRLSVLYRESDYELANTFRHDVEPCNGCGKQVIGSRAKGPILCEECTTKNIEGKRQ